MFTIFTKLTIFCYERQSTQKKKEFDKEKDNSWKLFLTREDNILNLLKR